MRVLARTVYLLIGILVVLGLIFTAWIGWEFYFERGLEVDSPSSEFSATGILNRSSLGDFTSGQASDPKTILLVTLDTTRTDHLSVYGYPRPTTPTLDSFSEKAVKFTRAFASMATTAPSHATMMTGLYPIQHRLLRNGMKMRKDLTTLAELLKVEGYRTAAFVSTDRHFGTSGVARGFDTYNDPDPREQIVTTADGDTHPLDYRPSRKTIVHAKRWIRENRSAGKVFLWVHFFDPHRRYVARNDYLEEISFDSRQDRRTWLSHVRRNHHYDLLDASGPSDLRASPVRLYHFYDAEIRYMDESLGELFAVLREYRGQDRLSVVVGDHGEGLGNHGWWGHGKHIYNEQVRVPLLVKFPGNRHDGETVDTVVETNDILPTVLRSIGADSETLRDRSTPVEGKPLQYALEGRGNFGYAFQQRRAYEPLDWNQYLSYRWFDFQRDWLSLRTPLRGELNYETGRTFALIDSNYKYIFRTRHRDEFYDIREDLYEQNNLIGKRSTASVKLGNRLGDLIKQLRRMSPSRTESVSPRIQRKLEGLGYVN